MPPPVRGAQLSQRRQHRLKSDAMVRCGDPLNDEAMVVRDALVLVEDI
jgi:hypothetical protein